MRRWSLFASAVAAASLATGAIGLATPALADVCPIPASATPAAYGAPPPLRAEVQPPIPGPGYIWTPGYWGWNDVADDYYWIPGVWVLPPAVGLLWTPPWWGYVGGVYVFNAGYWGPFIGFYGGIDYGFGYFGVGYVGGYWNGPTFYYNTVVNNFGGRRINTAFTRPVSAPRFASRASFNGPGGVNARASRAQLAAMRGPRSAATAQQAAHYRTAANDPRLRAHAGAAAHAATAPRQLAKAPMRQHTPRFTRAHAGYGHFHDYARAGGPSHASHGGPYGRFFEAHRGGFGGGSSQRGGGGAAPFSMAHGGGGGPQHRHEQR